MRPLELAAAVLIHRRAQQQRARSSPTALAQAHAAHAANLATVPTVQRIASPPSVPGRSGPLSAGSVQTPPSSPAPLATPPRAPPRPSPWPAIGSPAFLAYAARVQAWFSSLTPAEQAKQTSDAAAWIAQQNGPKLAKRPAVGAMPLDQLNWMHGTLLWTAYPHTGTALVYSIGGPVLLYPEFGWTVSGNGHEARAMVTRGSNDWVHWYVPPDGKTFNYQHDWGTGFDLSRAAQDVVNAAKSAASLAGTALDTIAHPVVAAMQQAEGLVDHELDELAAVLPPEARPFVSALKGAVHYLASVAEANIDPARIDWTAVADQVEAITSTVPVLGTAVSDIIATAEVAYDAITSGNPLAAALDAAYQYALASIPGAAELHQWIDPVFNLLLDIVVKGQSPTKAVVTAAVNQAPASPSIGPLSPRSVAASLASFVVSKLGLS